MSGCRSSVVKLMRNWAANGRTMQAMPVPSAKNTRASGIQGRADRRSLGRQPGRHERPQLVEEHGHREDDADHDRDLELDDERVAETGEEERRRRPGSRRSGP